MESTDRWCKEPRWRSCFEGIWVYDQCVHACEMISEINAKGRRILLRTARKQPESETNKRERAGNLAQVNRMIPTLRTRESFFRNWWWGNVDKDKEWKGRNDIEGTASPRSISRPPWRHVNPHQSRVCGRPSLWTKTTRYQARETSLLPSPALYKLPFPTSLVHPEQLSLTVWSFGCQMAAAVSTVGAVNRVPVPNSTRLHILLCLWRSRVLLVWCSHFCYV